MDWPGARCSPANRSNARASRAGDRAFAALRLDDPAAFGEEQRECTDEGVAVAIGHDASDQRADDGHRSLPIDGNIQEPGRATVDLTLFRQERLVHPTDLAFFQADDFRLARKPVLRDSHVRAQPIALVWCLIGASGQAGSVETDALEPQALESGAGGGTLPSREFSCGRA